jgi:hypothetical protein
MRCGEPFILKDYCDISKNIFIFLRIWVPILNKSAKEIYERRYALWITTILDPISHF